MDVVHNLLAVLPYLTAAICLSGFVWRLARWTKGTPAPAPLFPLPPGPLAATVREGAAICLLRGRRATSGRLDRLPAWLFHGALLLLALGHLRAVTDFPGVFTALSLSPAAVDRLAGISGLGIGLLALGALLALALRRILAPGLRQITRFEDGFALALLAAVVGSGLTMRLGPAVDLTPIRAYSMALATLHPAPLPDVPGFAAHFLLAQVLAVYAPFGKLLHITGIFGAKAGLDASLPGPA